MGAYMNQLKAKTKTLKTEALIAHFKRLNLSEAAIQEEMNILFPGARPRTIDSSPLNTTETATLKKLVKCDKWKDIETILGVRAGTGAYRFSRLAYRYLKHLK